MMCIVIDRLWHTHTDTRISSLPSLLRFPVGHKGTRPLNNPGFKDHPLLPMPMLITAQGYAKCRQG
jgi:hypothetical protein